MHVSIGFAGCCSDRFEIDYPVLQQILQDPLKIMRLAAGMFGIGIDGLEKCRPVSIPVSVWNRHECRHQPTPFVDVERRSRQRQFTAAQRVEKSLQMRRAFAGKDIDCSVDAVGRMRAGRV